MIQNQSLSLTELGLLGIIKFIWIMGAGVLTGILCGILGSLLTKFCTKDYQNLGKALFIYHHYLEMAGSLPSDSVIVFFSIH